MESEEQRRPPTILAPADDILEQAVGRCQLFGRNKPAQETAGGSAPHERRQPQHPALKKACKKRKQEEKVEGARQQQQQKQPLKKACKKRKPAEKVKQSEAKKTKKTPAPHRSVVASSSSSNGAANTPLEQAEALCKEVLYAWYEIAAGLSTRWCMRMIPS